MKDNSKPQNTPTGTTPEEADRFFEELQAVWDEHRRRVDRIVAEHDELAKVDFQLLEACRRREIAKRTAQTLLLTTIVVAIVLLFRNPSYDTPLRIAGFIVFCIILFIALRCLQSLLLLLVRRPSFWRLFPARWAFSRSVTLPLLSTPQFTSVCLAVCIFVLTVSCTPVGDGHTITQNIPDRVESVDTVTTILHLS